METRVRIKKLLLTFICIILLASCSPGSTEKADTHFKPYYSFEKDGTVYAELNLKFDETEEFINWMQIDVYSYREFYEILAGSDDLETIYNTFADVDWSLDQMAGGGSVIYADFEDENGKNLHLDYSFMEFIPVGGTVPFNAYKIYVDMTPKANGVHYVVTNRRKRAFELIGIAELYDRHAGMFKNDTSLIKDGTFFALMVNQ